VGLNKLYTFYLTVTYARKDVPNYCKGGRDLDYKSCRAVSATVARYASARAKTAYNRISLSLNASIYVSYANAGQQSLTISLYIFIARPIYALAAIDVASAANIINR